MITSRDRNQVEAPPGYLFYLGYSSYRGISGVDKHGSADSPTIAEPIAYPGQWVIFEGEPWVVTRGTAHIRQSYVYHASGQYEYDVFFSLMNAAGLCRDGIAQSALRAHPRPDHGGSIYSPGEEVQLRLAKALETMSAGARSAVTSCQNLDTASGVGYSSGSSTRSYETTNVTPTTTAETTPKDATPTETKKGATMSNQPSLASVLSEVNTAVLKGAQAGVAAALAETITSSLLKASGVELPAILASGIGRKVLPLAVCYAIVALTVLIPSFPKADAVRSVASLAANGSAVVLTKDLTELLGQISATVLGHAALFDLDAKE